MGMYWGGLSDRIGRKPVLLIGCLGTMFSMVMVGFASNIWIALLGRGIGGLLNGNIGVIQTMVGELVTKPEHERKLILSFFPWQCLFPLQTRTDRPQLALSPLCPLSGASEPSLDLVSAAHLPILTSPGPMHSPEAACLNVTRIFSPTSFVQLYCSSALLWDSCSSRRHTRTCNHACCYPRIPTSQKRLR